MRGCARAHNPAEALTVKAKSSLRLRAEKASGRHNKRSLKLTGFTAWGNWAEWNAWVLAWMDKHSQSDTEVKS